MNRSADEGFLNPVETPMTASDASKIIQASHPPERPPSLEDLQPKLTDFILHLIQAFLRTGYYTSEHPESKRAKEGLYQQFKGFFEQEGELTFLVKEDQDRKEVLLEGLFPEAQRLTRLMAKGMGELYVPRMIKYLERKDLVSLTLKSRMDGTEFIHFVDIMSEPSLVDIHKKEDQENFAQTLCRHEVFNISYIFNEELLDPAREMPWRVRLTLSRLRKDLKMVPLFHKMSGEELQEIRRKLIQDGIRPIRHPDLLCAVLQNSDLAATPENPEEFIEDGIIFSIHISHFLDTVQLFLKEHLQLKQLQKKDSLEKKSDRLAAKIYQRLMETGTAQAETLLEEFFRKEIISFENLPPNLRKKILVEKQTDRFLSDPTQFFRQLDQAQEEKQFLEIAQSFVEMIPELIRRDRYTEVMNIFAALKRYTQWTRLAGEILEVLGQGPIPLLLREKFLANKKEIRMAIVPIFIALEGAAIPNLLDILKTSEDQWVRKNACEALIQIGPAATAHLLKELEEQIASVETTGDILRVLGEIKSQEWKTPLLKVLARYISHEHPKLREQAIHTLCLIAGREGEEVFLSSLRDPHIEVRKMAVWCLGMIRSDRGLEKMVQILKQINTSPSPQMDQIETQIYHAFGTLGNMQVAGETPEEILLGILEKRGIKRWGGLFQKNPLTDSALGAICNALGKMGTQRSIKTLNELKKSLDGHWIPKVGEVLKKIEERAGYI
jgi:HEAT repeat protein